MLTHRNLVTRLFYTLAICFTWLSASASSLTVAPGGRVSISVTAKGTMPFTYQWKKNGANIAGATSATLSIASAAVSDAATYTALVSNSAGSTLSDNAVLTVSSPVAAPTITTQPVSVGLTQGNAASFTVVASGTSLSYQWYKNGVAISGATARTYTIAATALSDAGNYSVVVSNSAGSVTSSTVSLSVAVAVVAPTITTQPVSQTVTEGNSATFSVAASGSGLSYQWKKNNVAISGATGSAFTISAAQLSDAGSYTVVVSNSAGSATSNTATFTVTPKVTFTALAPSAYSARGENGVAEGLAKLFDGDIYSKWLDFSATSWVRVDFSTPTMLDAYSLTSANDAPERDPMNWTLSGSNDGVNWTVIDTHNNESWGSRFQTRDFALAQRSAGYTYYRFNFTAHSGNVTQLAELKLYGVKSDPIQVGGSMVQVVPSSYSARGENGVAEGLAKLFDGDVSSKWLDFSINTWVKVNFSAPTMLDAYSLTSANDAPERDPMNWTLSGSNDGVNWTVIETRSNESWSSRFQTRDFALAQRTAAYTQYRFEFTAHSGNVTQLGEMRLYGAQSGNVQVGTATQVVPSSFSARGENGVDEGLAKLFDGNSYSKWLDFSATTWVRMDFSVPTMLDSYNLTSANDAAERDPMNWTLSGSNDGVNWTVIETRTNQSWSSRFQGRDFALAQRSAAYTHYRFDFTAHSGNLTQLAELKLFGVQTGSAMVRLSPAAFNARGENGVDEGLAKLFDGNVYSKWLDFSAVTWVKVSFSSPTMLDAYSLASANDAPERDPMNWTLSGSNDGVNWTVIETHTNESWGARFQMRDFALVQRSAAYTQFRFDFTAHSGNVTQLAELELYGAVK
ncbi:MAG: discoidin domain-containing protein [Nibricoccus sp.]